MNRSGIIGVVLAVLGLILAIITCYLPNWTIMFIGNIANVQEGLWKKCDILKNCETNNDSSDVHLNVGRGMTIICILLSILALLGVFTVFTNLIKNEFKAKVCMGAGIALLVAGLFLLIPVSWYANFIFSNMHQFNYIKIGACIYTGWVGGVFLMLAGGLLFWNRRNP